MGIGQDAVYMRKNTNSLLLIFYPALPPYTTCPPPPCHRVCRRLEPIHGLVAVVTWRERERERE